MYIHQADKFILEKAYSVLKELEKKERNSPDLYSTNRHESRHTDDLLNLKLAKTSIDNLLGRETA